MIKRLKGSSIMEYVIPAALIALVAGSGLYLIYSKGLLTNFVAGSTATGYDKSTGKMVLGSAENKPNDLVSSKKPVSESSEDIIHPDGSVEFNTDGQKVILPAELIKTQEAILVGVETSGTPGYTDLKTEIAYLIKQHKADYPGENVPVEIIYGTGERKSFFGGMKGDTSLGTVTLRVDNHYVIYQYDKNCTGLVCSYKGIYRIDAKSTEDNKLKGTVTATAKTQKYKGDFRGTLTDESDSAKSLNGDLDLKLSDGQGGETKFNFDWTMNFDKNKKFDI